MIHLLKLIRPWQWTKNLFIFLPLFFGGALLHVDALFACVITFFSYSCLASSIYCYNDIYDVEADKQHSIKCARPIASGAISVQKAYILMFVMLALGLSLLCFLPFNTYKTMAVLLFYYAMNIAYCTKLKNFAIIDVCVVAFGFVLRILAGGVSTGITLSKWIVLMTFLLTLFLSFAKRRDDVIRMNETGKAPRKNTNRYNITFINQAITITAAITLVCYIMYTVSPEVVNRFHSDYLYLTSIFVLVGLLRYIQLAIVDEKTGDPTKILLKDRFTQAVVVGWIIVFGIIIYCP